jgi:small GTP-binding protein
MDLNLKVILLGDTTVGKTSIYTQFIKKEFHISTLGTIGMDNTKKTIELDGRTIKLSILDTPGNPTFRNITKNSIRNSDIIIIVFDITNKNSFENLENWYNFVKETLDTEKIVIGIAANKNDLEEKSEVTPDEYNSFSQNYNVDVFSVSATDHSIIEEMFLKLTEKYYNSFLKGKELTLSLNSRKSIVLSKSHHHQNKKKCCKN